MDINIFKLGDIVSLNTHPYYPGNTEIVVAGEHQLLSPLMIIGEILKDIRTQFDEKTGEEKSQIGSGQCKCFWYSHKSHQFEDAWISSKMLRVINRNENEFNKEDLIKSFSITPPTQNQTRTYYNVALRSNQIEYRKLKSSKVNEIGSFQTDIEKYSVTSNLAFVSPVMEIIQITETKEQEQNEPKYNSKTGEKRRILSDWQVKCKWFNPAGDKFSERILPISVLERIEPVNERVLWQVRVAMNSSKFLLLEVESVQTIVKPQQLIYLSGIYYLKGFDYLKNKLVDLLLATTEYGEVDNYFLDTYPKFNFIQTGILSEEDIPNEKRKGIENARKSKRYIRIRYKSRSEKLITRTLKNYELKPVSVKGSKTEEYLHGFDMSRKAERTFKFDEIEKIEILDLTY